MYVHTRCLTDILHLMTAACCSAFADVPKNRGIWVEVGSNVECDTSAGEKYIENSPGKLPDAEQCKKSCYYSAECQSITYLNTGWCSHFSTLCTKHKSNNKAVSMRLDTNPGATSTAGRFRLVMIRCGCCAWDRVGIPEPESVSSCSNQTSYMCFLGK